MNDTDPKHVDIQVRLYEWAKEQWQEELQLDSPRLQLVNNGDVRQFCRWRDALSVDDLQTWISAALKRFHPEAVNALGNMCTAEEITSLRSWDAWRRLPEQSQLDDLPATTVNKVTQRRLVDHELRRSGAFDLRNGRLGRPVSTLARGWRVETDISFEAHRNRCDYWQDLLDPDGRVVCSMVSLSSWLGLSSVTSFDIVDEASASAAGSGIVALCEHFIRAVPHLIRPRDTKPT